MVCVDDNAMGLKGNLMISTHLTKDGGTRPVAMGYVG